MKHELSRREKDVPLGYNSIRRDVSSKQIGMATRCYNNEVWFLGQASYTSDY